MTRLTFKESLYSTLAVHERNRAEWEIALQKLDEKTRDGIDHIGREAMANALREHLTELFKHRMEQ